MRTLLTGWILLALAGQATVAPAEGRCDSPDNETRVRGDILGRHPGVADAAVLAACPCFITEWRAGRRRWMQSLSPDEVIKQVPVATRVVALTGDADDNTRPILAGTT
jgi:hypothetical protein